MIKPESHGRKQKTPNKSLRTKAVRSFNCKSVKPASLLIGSTSRNVLENWKQLLTSTMLRIKSSRIKTAVNGRQ